MRSTKLTWWAAIAAFACAAIWAGQSVAVKVALEGLPPFTIMAARFLISLPFLYIVAKVSRVKLKPQNEDWKPLALSGGLLCLQIALFTLGTDATTSVQSTILINTFPFFAAFLGHFLLPDHKLKVRVILGISIAFAGVPLLMFRDLDNLASKSIAGGTMVTAAALVMGVKIVLMKLMLKKIKPVKLAFWDAAFALTAFSLLAFSLENKQPVSLTSSVLAAMAYQGLIVSVVGFLLWLYLLSNFSANQLNVFRFFTPPLGVLLGGVLLHETISSSVLISLLLISVGLYLVLGFKLPSKSQIGHLGS